MTEQEVAAHNQKALEDWEKRGPYTREQMQRLRDGHFQDGCSYNVSGLIIYNPPLQPSKERHDR